MSDQGNIFLTYENLAFSMPLIVVVGTYVFFTYIPLQYGLGMIAGLFMLYQVRQQLLAQKEKRLQNLDENAIRDIVGIDLDDEEDEKKKSATKQKAKNKVKQRLAQERKAEAKKASSKKKKGPQPDNDDDDDDEDLLLTFAKGSRGKPKKQ